MALVPSPQWLDTGDNAWQLAAATFVGLQSIPGLTVLYGGIVKKKWAINSAFMSIYAFASVLVVWVLFDYNMAFGPQWFPFLGTPSFATSAVFTTGQATIPAAASGFDTSGLRARTGDMNTTTNVRPIFVAPLLSPIGTTETQFDPAGFMDPAKPTG